MDLMSKFIIVGAIMLKQIIIRENHIVYLFNKKRMQMEQLLTVRRQRNPPSENHVYF